MTKRPHFICSALRAPAQILGAAALMAMLSFGVAFPSKAADFDTALAYYKQNQWLPAFLDFQILAAEGDARAQAYIGLMYRRGFGVAADLSEAEKWLRAGAEQGNAMANHRLGWMYASGEITGAPEFTGAVKHWKAAAEGGNHQAQMDLGVMYWRGEGTPQDLVLAYTWLDLAAEDPELSAAKSNQENLARSMTDEQIAQAQDLASALREDIAAR